MKNTIACLFMILLCALSFNVKASRIAELEFKHTKLKDIIRVLSEESNTNIVATPEAAEKNISIFLRHVTLEDAIKAMCRISGLWYRKDKEGRERTRGRDPVTPLIWPGYHKSKPRPLFSFLLFRCQVDI